jgi:hypothetical protein
MASETERLVIREETAGRTADIPPTFLERWGVVFLAFTGGWILLVELILMAYYLWKLPALPSLTGLSPEQLRDALAVHTQVVHDWRDDVTAIFDVLVTKTALPIVTLLLGYLFGRTKSGG